MKSSFNMSPDFGTGLGKLVVKAKQELVVKKVDPFEVGKHQPDGTVGPQVFSCAEKWPKKAGWYLACWGLSKATPNIDLIREYGYVRYIDPQLGVSDPIFPFRYQQLGIFQTRRNDVISGFSHKVEKCKASGGETIYWTDATLPDEVLETLKFLS